MKKFVVIFYSVAILLLVLFFVTVELWSRDDYKLSSVSEYFPVNYNYSVRRYYFTAYSVFQLIENGDIVHSIKLDNKQSLPISMLFAKDTVYVSGCYNVQGLSEPIATKRFYFLSDGISWDNRVMMCRSYERDGYYLWIGAPDPFHTPEERERNVRVEHYRVEKRVSDSKLSL